MSGEAGFGSSFCSAGAMCQSIASSVTGPHQRLRTARWLDHLATPLATLYFHFGDPHESIVVACAVRCSGMHPPHAFKFQCVHQFDWKRGLHRSGVDQRVTVDVLSVLFLRKKAILPISHAHRYGKHTQG